MSAPFPIHAGDAGRIVAHLADFRPSALLLQADWRFIEPGTYTHMSTIQFGTISKPRPWHSRNCGCLPPDGLKHACSLKINYRPSLLCFAGSIQPPMPSYLAHSPVNLTIKRKFIRFYSLSRDTPFHSIEHDKKSQEETTLDLHNTFSSTIFFPNLCFASTIISTEFCIQRTIGTALCARMASTLARIASFPSRPGIFGRAVLPPSVLSISQTRTATCL